jgi:hypothetical protein
VKNKDEYLSQYAWFQMKTEVEMIVVYQWERVVVRKLFCHVCVFVLGSLILAVKEKRKKKERVWLMMK